MLALRACLYCILIFAAARASALESNFKNLDTLARASGLARLLAEAKPQKTVKIAILDNGFKGYQKEIGRSLPANTVYHAGPVAPGEQEEVHGLGMAQILTGLLTENGRSSKIPFELHLVSGYGYTNLEAATKLVVAEKFDIVLYAQVWEYGGNGDGGGFINALVTPVARAGVIWINAAGNFGKNLHTSKFARMPDDWASLPGPNQSVQIRCHRNTAGKCRLRLILSWNDFKENASVGTDKDLDLVLTDDTLKIIQTSGLTQKSDFPVGQPGFSRYPREIITAELKPGVYYARVKIRSQNFTEADRLTIIASGEAIEVLDRTKNETIMNPADNPLVITAGATDTDVSSQSVSLLKPELRLPSILELPDGTKVGGSSNSAAVAAAIAAVMRSDKPDLTREELISRAGLRNTRTRDQRPTHASPPAPTPSPAFLPSGRGLPLDMLLFRPTGPGGCFQTVAFVAPWAHLARVIQDGGRPVQTTAGVKIFLPVDPLKWISGLRRVRSEDMVVAVPSGFRLLPRTAQGRVPSAIELLELPLGARICGMDRLP